MKNIVLLGLALPWLAPPPAVAEPAPPALVAQAAEADDDAGAARAPGQRRAPAPALRYGVNELLLEAGALPDAPEADTAATLRASAYVLWQPSRQWEWRAGARFDAAAQRGGEARYSDASADLADTYVRWRSGDTRITLGAQTVVWGRADAVPLVDRVSRTDLTRFLLDDLVERRRAQVAARWEQTWGDFKLDVVALPWFRGAKLPDVESVWSPINRTTGRIIGIAPSAPIAALVQAARIEDDESGSGGAGVRLTRTGEPFDAGLTLARTRASVPYFRVGADPLAPTLTGTHPLQNFAGVDAEWVTGDLTWRTEFGYTSDVPATRPSAQMVMTDAVEWIGGVEFFPGGKDTRVTLQLLARSLRTGAEVLELKHYVGTNGEVESTFAQGRWKVALRFAGGLNVRDLYLGPRISFLGWEPHEIYLAGHFFSGEARTLGGFHREHDMIALGLRTRF
jgi:hypothetical protein